MRKFVVHAPYELSGDQGPAVKKLSDGFLRGDRFQTLKGVTGSGKTFTMAKIIEAVQRPTLVISHNKTLSAQLYREFKTFFPNNAVEYFVSYYDYYQPEAYVPARDLYIEKDAAINKEIDQMKMAATYSLMERRDVIVIATVSCIYGLGMPELYKSMRVHIEKGKTLDTNKLSVDLAQIQYHRNDMVLERGSFRIKGDVIEIYPPYMEFDEAYRIELDWEEVVRIRRFNALSGKVTEELDETVVYPAKNFVVPQSELEAATERIQKEMEERVEVLRSQKKMLEAERLKTRVTYDIEMMKEMGYCSGIENYSRIIERRPVGSAPATLLDYFRGDFLTVIDESHVTLPQLNGMYHGDASRKQVLVDFGFRLPCAKDNRPLKWGEFFNKVGQKIYISATPGEFEKKTSEQLVEQIIRPTGLVDPKISVRPIETQIDDLKTEIAKRAKKDERVLITTLTKRMAEDLCDYFLQDGIRVRYLHSGIKSIERVEILRDLRLGEFDVLIGVNLLREGLDIPEVSLVAIMDADKEGFLRSDTSLIQTIGRAARNACGAVIMYADKITDSMQRAIDETNRRREIQLEYNKKYGIVPKTIKKPIENNLLSLVASYRDLEDIVAEEMVDLGIDKKDLPKLITKLEKDMHKAAKILDFERAAQIRDQLKKLREMRK